MELEIENRDTLFNHHYFYDHYWQFGMEGNHSDLVQLPSSHAFETYHQQWHHTKEDPAGHHFSVNQMVSFSKKILDPFLQQNKNYLQRFFLRYEKLATLPRCAVKNS